jgi:RimJ/RimL family protein N-acetyltransferase
MNDLRLHGEHVRLIALNTQKDIELLVRWSALSASWRLLDGTQARPARAAGQNVGFLVYPISGERPIGHAGLFGIRPSGGEAWLGFGLGSREHWDSPVSAEALRLVLDCAFGDLHLRRVLLGVFDYDARVLRTYEAAGFTIGGRMIQEPSRDRHMRAGVCMALRREAWPMQAGYAVPGA